MVAIGCYRSRESLQPSMPKSSSVADPASPDSARAMFRLQMLWQRCQGICMLYAYYCSFSQHCLMPCTLNTGHGMPCHCSFRTELNSWIMASCLPLSFQTV